MFTGILWPEVEEWSKFADFQTIFFLPLRAGRCESKNVDEQDRALLESNPSGSLIDGAKVPHAGLLYCEPAFSFPSLALPPQRREFFREGLLASERKAENSSIPPPSEASRFSPN